MQARWTQWSEDHIAPHGVTWTEVEEALAPPIVVENGERECQLVLGSTFGGRYLLIVVAPDPDAPTVFVITARGMTDAERRRYRNRIGRG